MTERQIEASDSIHIQGTDGIPYYATFDNLIKDCPPAFYSQPLRGTPKGFTLYNSPLFKTTKCETEYTKQNCHIDARIDILWIVSVLHYLTDISDSCGYLQRIKGIYNVGKLRKIVKYLFNVSCYKKQKFQAYKPNRTFEASVRFEKKKKQKSHV